MHLKYVVLKKQDLHEALDGEINEDLRDSFNTTLDMVKMYRDSLNKKENTYLVINTDEPYADEVIEILKKNGHWDK
jgi:hypothetical protein